MFVLSNILGLWIIIYVVFIMSFYLMVKYYCFMVKYYDDYVYSVKWFI